MRVIVVLSGGMDSTVLLAQCIANGHEVEALSVFYGQRHRRELDAAGRIALHYHIPWTLVNIPGLRDCLEGSSQTSHEVPVPHGHYADENMKITVVPNRNMILLAVAGARAVSRNAEAIAYAAHAGDHAIYPDCRPEFVFSCAETLRLANENPVALLAPYLTFSKADICRLGDRYAVPFHLTYSCYEGGEEHCGQCGTCVERREAFVLAGVDDPTHYRETMHAEAGSGI